MGSIYYSGILLRNPKKLSLDSWQWPDDKLFGDLVTELITRASRRVPAAGEMVAPLLGNR